MRGARSSLYQKKAKKDAIREKSDEAHARTASMVVVVACSIAACGAPVVLVLAISSKRLRATARTFVVAERLVVLVAISTENDSPAGTVLCTEVAVVSPFTVVVVSAETVVSPPDDELVHDDEDTLADAEPVKIDPLEAVLPPVETDEDTLDETLTLPANAESGAIIALVMIMNARFIRLVYHLIVMRPVTEVKALKTLASRSFCD